VQEPRPAPVPRPLADIAAVPAPQLAAAAATYAVCGAAGAVLWASAQGTPSGAASTAARLCRSITAEATQLTVRHSQEGRGDPFGNAFRLCTENK